MPGYFALIWRMASIVSIAVAPRLFLAGRDREGEAVDDDVVDAHPPVVDEGVDRVGRRCAPCRSAVRAWPCFVDRQRDDGRAVLLHERHDAAEAAVRAIAVLEVDRVDDGAAADEFEAGLEHGGFGRVDHERAGSRRSRSARRPRGCRRRRRARRSRCRRRAGARRRGSDCGRSRRSRPSALRASPRGTPSSRWRWCARRWRGRTRPGRTARAGRGWRHRDRLDGGRVRPLRSTAQCEGAAARRPRACAPASCRSIRRSGPRPNSRTNCSCAVASSVGVSG